MALRLRRGTDAERQLITPAAGELIYTTDTKALYIGDGTTAGGVVVQGAGGGGGTLGGLTDVTLGSISDGQVLAWSSSDNYWRAVNPAGATLGNLNNHDDVIYPAGGAGWGMTLVHDGNSFKAEQLYDSQIKLSIVGNNSSLLVDHQNNRLAGDLHGGDLYKLDGSQLIDTSTSTIKNMTIQAGDGTSAYNPTTKLFNGDLIGNFQGDIFDTNLRKVFDKTTGQWLGDIQGDIFSSTDDSTKLLDSFNGSFNGTVNGKLVGTMNGSVFGEDSSLLVDGINSKITGQVSTQLGVLAGNIKLTSATSKNIMFLEQNSESNVLTITTENTAGTLVLGRNSQIGGASDTGADRTFGVYNDAVTQGTTTIRTFHASDAGYGNTYGALRARGTKAAPTAVQSGDQLGAYAAAGYNGTAYRASGGIRFLASAAPEANRIPTNIELYNSASNGDQTVVLQIAQTDSVATFSGAIQLKVVADDTARSAAVTAPAAGMIIFNSTGTKFQGYTGAAWVDLN
mgnify:FL=1|tara:strand:+ start:2058 stop:3587 length:1530 start_codon:yes stop_codon:yes gene_type:complete